MSHWDQDEPLLNDVVRLLRRGMVPALLVAVVLTAAAVYFMRTQAHVYESRSVLVGRPVQQELRTTGVPIVTVSPLSAEAYRAALFSSPVLTHALELLESSQNEVRTPEDLRERIDLQTSAESGSPLLEIHLRGESPTGAAALLAAVVDAVVAWDSARARANIDVAIQTLENQVAGFDLQLQTLPADDASLAREDLVELRREQQVQLATLRAVRSSAVGALAVVEPATVPSTAAGPHLTRVAAAVFFASLLLVYALVLVRDATSSRLRNDREIGRLARAPVIGSFRRPRRGASLPREDVNYLRSNLLFTVPAASPRMILVTSPRGGEGASAVARGLAESSARNGETCLLVDADLRSPTVAETYGIRPIRGRSLNALLEDEEADLMAAADTLALSNAHFHLLRGEVATAPAESLNRGFGRLAQRCRERFSTTVVLAPPLLDYADALAIAPHCTGVVLVVAPRVSDREDLQDVVELLDRAKAAVLGVAVMESKRGARRPKARRASAPRAATPAKTRSS